MTSKRKRGEASSPQAAKKQKVGSAESGSRPSGRGKRNPTERPDNANTATAKSDLRSGANDEWEVLNGDDRTRLLVGVEAPDRLTLTFRNKKTGKEQSYTFPDIEHENIDWNSQSHIAEINKWKTRTFLDMGYEELVRKVFWTDDEAAFVRLFYEKLVAATTTKKEFTVPNSKKIAVAFNAFFDALHKEKRDQADNVDREHRSSTSIASFVRRKDDRSRLRKDYEQLIEYAETASGAVYMPTITTKELNEYMRKEGKSFKELDVANGKKGGKPSKKPTVGKSQPVSGLVDDEPKTRQSEEQSSGGNSEPVAPSQKLPIKKPLETETIPISDETIKQMTEDGWAIPTFPVNNEATLGIQSKENRSNRSDYSWIKQTEKGFLERLHFDPLKVEDYYSRCKPRELWYSSRPGDSKTLDEVDERRDPRAASINGLLNAAVIPPVGYRGSLHDLVADQAAFDPQRPLAEASAAVRVQFDQYHDEAFNSKVPAGIESDSQQMEG